MLTTCASSAAGIEEFTSLMLQSAFIPIGLIKGKGCVNNAIGLITTTKKARVNQARRCLTRSRRLKMLLKVSRSNQRPKRTRLH